MRRDPEYHPGHYNLGPRFLPLRLACRIERVTAPACWRLRRVGGLHVFKAIYRGLYRFEFREYRP